MFKSSDLLKMEFILELIDDIEFIVEHNRSITLSLQDRIHKPALLMSLMQIGETLNKIESITIKAKLPIKGSYDVRNFIAHDYEGVDLALIEHIIRSLIPELKSTIQGILIF